MHHDYDPSRYPAAHRPSCAADYRDTAPITSEQMAQARAHAAQRHTRTASASDRIARATLAAAVSCPLVPLSAAVGAVAGHLHGAVVGAAVGAAWMLLRATVGLLDARPL